MKRPARIALCALLATGLARAGTVSLQVQEGYVQAGQPITVAVSCQGCGPMDTIGRLYIDAPTAAYAGTWQPGGFFAATPTVMAGPGWGDASMGLGLHIKTPIRTDWPRSGIILTFQLQPVDGAPVTVALVQDMIVQDGGLAVPDVPHDPTVHAVIQYDNTNMIALLTWEPHACFTTPPVTQLLACWSTSPAAVVSQAQCAWLPVGDTSALYWNLGPDAVTLAVGEILYWRTVGYDGIGFLCTGAP